MERRLYIPRGTIAGRNTIIDVLGVTDTLWVRARMADGRAEILPGHLLSTPAPGRQSWGFPLPEGLVKSLTVLPAADGPELETGPDFELTDLLPEAPPDGLPAVFVRKNRIRDVPTLRFMVEQLLESPAYGPLVKTEAVKVLGYMAVEDGDSDFVIWALALLDTKLAQASGDFTSAKGSSKQHPVHVEISLRFIRVLALLSLGRYEEALAEFALMAAHDEAVGKVPIIAFNLSQATLLSGWILARGGETEAAEARLKAVIAIFRAAAQTMPSSKAKLFGELSTSLQAATAASDLLAGLAGRFSLDWEGQHGPNLIAQRFSRLTTSASQQRMAASLAQAAQFVAARRNGAAGGSPRG